MGIDSLLQLSQSISAAILYEVVVLGMEGSLSETRTIMITFHTSIGQFLFFFSSTQSMTSIQPTFDETITNLALLNKSVLIPILRRFYSTKGYKSSDHDLNT